MVLKNLKELTILFLVLFYPYKILAKPYLPSVAEAKFLVSSGNTNYSIPLKLPPGTKKMQPILGLSYSNQTPNGFTGIGWELSGLSLIERCGATIVQDGFRGGVAYNSKDRFCMESSGVADGRLVPLNASSPYFSPGTEYRTETETWRKVIANGTCGSGPCSFTVTSKKGTVYNYGSSPDSQVLAVSAVATSSLPKNSVRMWLLKSITDLNGNSLIVTYSDSPINNSGAVVQHTSGAGVVYPVRIDYTIRTGSVSPMPPLRSVQFLYETRNDRPTHYQGGAKFTTAARLSSIQTCINSTDISSLACSQATLVKQFNLDYEYGETEGTSRLQSIEECDGANTCLPPTTLAWSDGPTSFFAQENKNSPVGLEQDHTYLGDYNGDGLTDIIYTASPEQGIYLATKSGLKKAKLNTKLQINLTNPDATTWVADYNGDGLSDILIRVTSSQSILYISSGDFCTKNVSSKDSCTQNGFVPYPFKKNKGLPGDAFTWIGDFNGDGSADLFLANQHSGQPYYSTGTGFDEGKTIYKLNFTDQASTLLGDYNGDGLTDLLSLQNQGSTGYIYYATASGFTHKKKDLVKLSLGSLSSTWVGDFNGDGLSDIFSTEDTTGAFNYSTGTGFKIKTVTDLGFYGAHNWIGDYNADGLSDILSVNGSKAIIFYSTGSGFNKKNISNFNLVPDYSLVGEFNGDGATDVLSYSGTDNYYYLAGHKNQKPTSNQKPNLLTSITNRLGGQIQITYKPITDSSVYSPNTSSSSKNFGPIHTLNQYLAKPLAASFFPSYPVHDKVAHGSLYVVSDYILQNDNTVNSANYSYNYNYFYEQGLINLIGRGWLGFGSITRKDPQLQAQVKRTYYQDYPYTGRVKTTTRSSITGDNDISTKTYSVTCRDGISFGNCNISNTSYSPSNTKIFQVLLDSMTNQDFIFGNQIQKNYTYDNYGNLTQLSNLGDTQNKSIPVYTCNSYNNNTSSWQLGYRKYTKTSESSTCGQNITTWDSDSLRLKQYLYDDNMNVTTSVAWDNQNNLWLGKRNTFDNYGNKTSVAKISNTNPAAAPLSNSTTTIAFDPVFNSFPEKITSPNPDTSDSKSAPLIKSYAYDSRFGLRIVKQGPNDNNFFVRCLDGFGRTVSTQGPVPNSNVTSSDTACVDSESYYTSLPKLNVDVVTLTEKEWEKTSGTQIYNTVNILTDWPEDAGLFTHIFNKVLGDDSSWHTSNNYVDGLNRNISSEVEADTSNIITNRSYLNPKLLKSRTLPYFEGSSSSDIQNVSMEYNELGMIETKTLPYEDLSGISSITTAYEYSSPNSIQITYAKGASAEYTKQLEFEYYNSKRKITKLTIPSDNNATTSYGYTTLGTLNQSTSPVPAGASSGVVTTVEFDSLGRKISFSEDNMGTVTFDYSPNGTLNTRTDAKNQVMKYSYDNLNRIRSLEFYDANNNLQQTNNFTYDYSSDPTTYKNTIGKLSQVSVVDNVNNETDVSYSYGYNTYRKTSVKTSSVLGGLGYTVQKEFDPLRRSIKISYPDADNTEVQFAYTNLGNLSEIVSSNEDLGTTTYDDYNAFSQPQSISYGNGAKAALSYDVVGRVKSEFFQDKQASTLISNAFNWDTLGQLSETIDCNYSGNASNPACSNISGSSTTNKSQSFSYLSKRLTNASMLGGSDTYSYSYDQAGNIANNNGTNYSYDGNQIVKSTSDSSFSAQYDANGNMVSKTVNGVKWTYNYSVANKLLSVASNGNTLAEFVYDHRGRRVRKLEYGGDNPGTTTDYNFSFFQIASQGENANPESTLFINGLFGPLASSTSSPEQTTSTDSSKFFYQNQVLSTQVATDEEGSLSSELTYEPYGKISAVQPPKSDTFRPKFGSKEYDSSTGLYYFNARYLDPSIGRFITADKGKGAGLYTSNTFNRYAYVLNNPVNLIDPTGAKACAIVAGVTWFGTAVTFATAQTALLYYVHVGFNFKESAIIGSVPAPFEASAMALGAYGACKSRQGGNGGEGQGEDLDGGIELDNFNEPWNDEYLQGYLDGLMYQPGDVGQDIMFEQGTGVGQQEEGEEQQEEVEDDDDEIVTESEVDADVDAAAAGAASDAIGDEILIDGLIGLAAMGF